jgi:hypothetical protein
MKSKFLDRYLELLASKPSSFKLQIKVYWLNISSTIFLWPLTQFKLISAYIDNGKHTSEDLKEATSRNRWSVLGTCAVHLLPVIITIILFFLNGLETYSDSIGPNVSNLNARLNALQFAAKIHEILIGASFSTMGLNLLQYNILNGGIPLGGLLAGFRINDLCLLLSPEFWAIGTQGNKKFWFIALVLSLLTIMATICGPASAILMLPTLGWWEVSVAQALESWARSATKSKPLFFMGANESLLWPTKISDENYPPYICDASNATDSLSIPEDCPGGGASVIFDWARAAGPSASKYRKWNITMPLYQKGLSVVRGATFNRFLEGSSYFDWRFEGSSNYAWSLSQTISTPAAESIVSIARTFSSENDTTRWKHTLSDGSYLPAVQVFASCSTTTFRYYYDTGLVVSNDGRRVGMFQDGSYQIIMPTYNSADMKFDFPLPLKELHRSWSINASDALDLWNTTQKSVAIWANADGEIPSIGAAMILCETDQLVDGPCRQFDHSYYLRFVTCSVFARWQPMEIFIDPSIDTFVHSPGVDNPDNTMDKWLRSNATGFEDQKIELDIDWANSALPPNQTLIPIATSLIPKHKGDARFAVGIAVTTLIADAISRIGMSKPVFLKGNFVSSSPMTEDGLQDILPFNGSESDLANFTPIDIRQWRNGYSYSLNGSTKYLAVAILFIHILLALIHTLFVVWIGLSFNILKSVSDVVALAINSSPSSLLENTCVGIARLDTYKYIIMIREVSKKHLGLVLKNEEGNSKSVVPGKIYGNLNMKKGNLKIE